MLDAIAGQLGIGPELHFFQDPAAEAADGAGADGESFPDAVERFSGGEHFQDVKFPIAQELV